MGHLKLGWCCLCSEEKGSAVVLIFLNGFSLHECNVLDVVCAVRVAPLINGENQG